MSKIDYNKFKTKLSKKQKDQLEDIYKQLYEDLQHKISEGIRIDLDHLKLINFCANFFQFSSKIDLDFGYKLLTIEPLYGTGLKNFDLGIYNQKDKCLILVECKSSISNINDELEDLKKTIDQTNKELLEDYIGIGISRIEFVICADGNIARDLSEKIFEKNLPICTWSCSQTRNELKLFQSVKENHGSAITSNRVHLDEKLNEVLFKGIKSIGNLMLYPLIPSSNLCIILTHINLTLKTMQEKGEISDDIGYGEIFHILKKELVYSTLNDKNIEKLVENVINKALIKEIYSDETKDVKELKRKKLKIKISKQTADKLKENIIKNYINKNADEKAKEESIKKIKLMGIKSMDEYIK